MRSRLHALLFGVAIFVLASLSMIVFYAREFVLAFWLTIALIVAYPFAFVVFVHILAGNGKLGAKKILLLTSTITIVAVAVTNVAWLIGTPTWSFSVTTDKSSYRLGEDVEVRVTLTNTGFISHSFTFLLSDPILVSIEYQPTENPTSTLQVWYSPHRMETTRFSLGPNQSLQRTFIWNQTITTNCWFFNQSYMLGTYQIVAWIQDAEAIIEIPSAYTLFIAYTSMKITSS